MHEGMDGWMDGCMYRLKISQPSNAFATRCKLRVNVLVEKSNAFATSFFTNAFGLCYSILTPLGCVVGMLKID